MVYLKPKDRPDHIQFCPNCGGTLRIEVKLYEPRWAPKTRKAFPIWRCESCGETFTKEDLYFASTDTSTDSPTSHAENRKK
jgi:ribosomal protein L37AE/L43A